MLCAEQPMDYPCTTFSGRILGGNGGSFPGSWVVVSHFPDVTQLRSSVALKGRSMTHG